MADDKLALFPLDTSAKERINARRRDAGGGPPGGGMDYRVDRLEVKLDRIDDRLRAAEIGMATLNERVAHLPSKGFIVVVVTGSATLLGVFSLYLETIKAVVGL